LIEVNVGLRRNAAFHSGEIPGAADNAVARRQGRQLGEEWLVCNRYASDIRKAGMERDYYGFEEWSETRINSVLEVFPKSIGPVIKLGETGQRQWMQMRWGLPGPKATGGAPVTNIRNIKSPHWRPLLGAQHRCLVPFTAFSEYEDASPKGAKVIRWFAPPDRGTLFFAGICGEWYGDYGSKKEPHVGTHKLFSFLTTEANDLVRPVHAKAMPVILRGEHEIEEWLMAAADQIEIIQARVLPVDALEIVGDEEAAQFVGGYLK
jgi:putative SOS response-associated peptidase YedK